MTSPPTPAPRLIVLLAVGAGLSAAGLYYSQPMLGMLAGPLQTTPARLGLIPTATQLGYAAGLLLFAPLGDMLERRRLIVVKAGLLAIALVAASASRDVIGLAVASLAIGLLGTVAQDLVPAAASMAPPASRGRIVGSVMTGLLLGILLSRVVSGAITAWWSWRAVFAGAALVVMVFAALAARLLPAFPPLARGRYLSLLASMVALLREVAPLRRAALTQGLLAMAFSGFWSTLALGLAAPPFEASSLVAGSFGIAGAAGAVAAPVAGGIADRRGPGVVIVAGASLSLASFAAMAVGARSLAVLAVGTLTFDLGVQACLIAHQSIVYAENPGARSRLNALLVSAMFVGMSAGSALASRVFIHHGLAGVCAFCAAACAAALVARALLR